MQQLSVQQKIKPWMGFVLFAIVMVFFLTAGKAMQRHWGILGLLSCEFSLLVIAVLYGLIFKIPLKEMFPVKKFTARDFFGSFLLILGGAMFGLISISLTALVFPSSLNGSDVEAISRYTNGGYGYLITIFVIAVTPGICEETIHRGAILSNFRSFKKEWLIVLIMGLFFGINHWSVLRFVNTFIMGCCLSYVLVKKNNIVLTSIMHFLLNFTATTYSYLVNLVAKRSGGVTVSGSDISAVINPDSLKPALGSFLRFGLPAPFLIVLGLLLLNPASFKKSRFIIAGIISAVMFICAAGITFYETDMNIYKNNISYTVVAEGTESRKERFEVIEGRNYNITCTMLNSDGDYDIRIEKTDGTVVLNEPLASGTAKTYNREIRLEKGWYYLVIINRDNSLHDKPVFSMQIRKA